jgi:hypothetical protein
MKSQNNSTNHNRPISDRLPNRPAFYLFFALWAVSFAAIFRIPPPVDSLDASMHIEGIWFLVILCGVWVYGMYETSKRVERS